MRTLIAGGGTGGHLTPALAVAQTLQRSEADQVVIVGRRDGVAEQLVRDAGIQLETLAISGLDLSSFSSLWRFVFRLPGAVLAARRLIKSFDPDVVVGAAGYVCVPVVLAARSLRRPVVLMEQNALPGRAVRLLAPLSSVIATSYEETAAHLKGRRVVWTGNPVRPSVLATPRRPVGELPRHLLVMGGSQGARRINQALAGCLARLLAEDRDLEVVHQSGSLDHPEMAAVAEALPADLRPRYRLAAFYDPIAPEIAQADLVIMRAGGSSLAECSALGRPMILIPYPHAGAHQKRNAAPYVAGGAALEISDEDCTAERLSAEIGRLRSNPAQWRRMAERSEAMAKPEAAEKVAEVIRQAARGAPR